jgi:succinate-acetate transporter protein
MIPRVIAMRLLVLGLIVASAFAWGGIAARIADMHERRAAAAWGTTAEARP